jgi:polyhydroxyalkanoate synthesis regulator phasin
MPILDKLKNVFTGGASKLVDSASNLIDNLTLSKEEKEQFKIDFIKATNEHLQVMEQEATKQMEIQQKENDSARQREVQVATSDKAPVLNKILSPLLALLILGSTFLFWYFILFKDLNKEKEMLVSGIVGSLTTLSMGVVSYYFGSSIGSHQKQERLDKLMK